MSKLFVFSISVVKLNQTCLNIRNSLTTGVVCCNKLHMLKEGEIKPTTKDPRGDPEIPVTDKPTKGNYKIILS